MAVKRPWRDGLRPVPGSWRLVALRWLLFVLAAAPGLAAGIGGIGQAVGNRPYFAEAPDPLPLLPMFRLLGETPGAVWGLTVLAAVVVWLGHQVLTASAVTLFGAPGSGRPRVLRAAGAAGARWLWVYLRIGLTAFVLAVVGARLIGGLGERLVDHAVQAHWTMRSQLLLQAGRGLSLLGWLTLVGVFAWWCRVIVVADERHRVRRVWALVPRLWRRHPVGALLAHFLLAGGGLFAGAAVLFAWRQSPAGAGGWAVAWLTLLAGLSLVWHWRLRAGRLLWSSPGLIDLRTSPDVPWGLWGRLRNRLRRRRPAEPSQRDPRSRPAGSG